MTNNERISTRYHNNTTLSIRTIYKVSMRFEASRGAAAQSVTVKPTGCGFDPHSRR